MNLNSTNPAWYEKILVSADIVDFNLFSVLNSSWYVWMFMVHIYMSMATHVLVHRDMLEQRVN